VAAIVTRLQNVCQQHGSGRGAYFNGAKKFVLNNDQNLLIDWLDAIENGTVDLVKIDGVAGWITSKITNNEQPPRPLLYVDRIPDEYKDAIVH